MVVVGPPPAPDRAAGVPRVDALLAELSASAGLTYLSMAGTDIEYLADGLHPTVAGHRAFGDLVAAALLAPPGLTCHDRPTAVSAVVVRVLRCPVRTSPSATS